MVQYIKDGSTRGVKLPDALKSIIEKLKKPAALQVGFLSGATYPDGTPVAMIAAIQNYGAPAVGIPPRPFFSNMIDEKSEGWPKGIATQFKINDYDVEKTLSITGEAIVGQLRQSIADTNSPPLKESTLRGRGVAPDTVYDPSNPSTFGAKPLVRTGHMLNSAAFRVKT